MTAFLCSQHLWGIVSGRESSLWTCLLEELQLQPPVHLLLSQPSLLLLRRRRVKGRELKASGQKKMIKHLVWFSFGCLIALYSLCGLSAYHTWRNLEEQFGKPGAAMIFAYFRALMAFRLTGGNPAPEISKMITLLERLCANNCEFNGFVQSMILLNVLPQKWDHITSVYI